MAQRRGSDRASASSGIRGCARARSCSWSWKPARMRYRLHDACSSTYTAMHSRATATPTGIPWDVPEAGEGGRLVVPPRGHRPHSDAVLTTAHRGTLRLSRDGRLFVIIGNSGGRPCAESDTVPVIAPPPRFFFPDDIGRTVSPPSDTALRYYRRLLRVAFFDTTGGEQVRA